MKLSLEEWTTRKELHLGLKQKDTAQKPLAFPEQLLIILFTHRFAVTDEASLNDLKRLVSTDFLPIEEQIEPHCDFFEPNWLGPHLVMNIVELIRNTIGIVHAGDIQTRVLKTPKHTATRLRMAIFYTTTKAFVQILLRYGANPKLPKDKEFDGFRTYLRKRHDDNVPTTATEVILDALPYILQHYMKKSVNKIIQGLPKKTTSMSDKWVLTVTLDDFNLFIPAKVIEGDIIVDRGISITEYFYGIFDGIVSYDDVLTYAPVPVEPTDEKKVKIAGSRGGGGGGGGSGTPKKKQPNIDIEQVQRCLSTIDTGVQNIRGGVDTEAAMTSITEATTAIRTILSPPTAITEATPAIRTLLSPPTEP